MKTQEIRIMDGKGNVLSPTLSDILNEFDNGVSFYWIILFLDGTPNPGQGRFIMEYGRKINDSENGIPISWEDLIALSDKFYQMFETTILGSKDTKLLRRYENEKEMYTTCDIVIDLIDCTFWEVYSKDLNFLIRLQNKFQKIEPLLV